MTQSAVRQETESAQVVIDGLLPGGFALCSPVTVEVWHEGDEYVAAAPDLSVHAFGPTTEAAIASLRQTIVDIHLLLEDDSVRLAPPIVAQRDRLRSVLIANGA